MFMTRFHQLKGTGRVRSPGQLIELTKLKSPKRGKNKNGFSYPSLRRKEKKILARAAKSRRLSSPMTAITCFSPRQTRQLFFSILPRIVLETRVSFLTLIMSQLTGRQQGNCHERKITASFEALLSFLFFSWDLVVTCCVYVGWSFCPSAIYQTRRPKRPCARLTYILYMPSPEPP